VMIICRAWPPSLNLDIHEQNREFTAQINYEKH
jgi:hypothetical protein